MNLPLSSKDHDRSAGSFTCPDLVLQPKYLSLAGGGHIFAVIRLLALEKVQKNQA